MKGRIHGAEHIGRLATEVATGRIAEVDFPALAGIALASGNTADRDSVATLLGSMLQRAQRADVRALLMRALQRIGRS